MRYLRIGVRSVAPLLAPVSRFVACVWFPCPRASHLGTLGTGNHFIEVCLDERRRVWFMLHSGRAASAIASPFLHRAGEKHAEVLINLPDRSRLPPQSTEHFNDYVEAVHWRRIALRTVKLMMAIVRRRRSGGPLPRGGPHTTSLAHTNAQSAAILQSAFIRGNFLALVARRLLRRAAAEPQVSQTSYRPPAHSAAAQSPES